MVHKEQMVKKEPKVLQVLRVIIKDRKVLLEQKEKKEKKEK